MDSRMYLNAAGTERRTLEPLESLRNIIRGHPIIDNHAHNLLRPHQLNTWPFESITTEAQGPALDDTYKSLSHIRAAKQLKSLYEVDYDNWADLKNARQEWLQRRPDELFRRCFEGIHTILMDDGLDANTVEDYSWHDTFTTSPTKRIVRIEVVAETLIQSILNEHRDPISSWAESQRSISFLRHFKSVFMVEILKSVSDPDVVGFKSVICYRTGLDVQTKTLHDDPHSGLPILAFQAYINDCVRTNLFRLNHKALNDWILSIAMQGILSSAKSKRKPIQFHTGLGDNDMSLRKSNPSYLQELIEFFPEVPIVLLHASYPYTREAGYLACVFKNVYLDVGEIFPMISRDGQLKALAQSLELVPGNKLLWSTDGHWFPETYWLAVRQFRSALEELLITYINNGDFTVTQAIDLAKDIMFNNSNDLYKLNLESGYKGLDLTPSATHSRVSPQPETGIRPVVVRTDSNFYTPLHLNDPTLDFVYLQWIDYIGTMRARVLPIKQFRKVISGDAKIGMSRGNTGTLPNDTSTPAVNTTGQIILEPDLNSFRETHQGDTLRIPQNPNWPRESKSATVMAYWRNESGDPLASCPRNTLESLLKILSSQHNIQPLLGFEVEVVFLARDSSTDPPTYSPFTKTHAWSTLTPDQWTALSLLREITIQLGGMGIEIQQFHAEAGPGQFELILPPAPPLAAIDALIQARTAIQQIAHSNGLRATFHPSPLGPTSAGTGAHVHISLNEQTPIANLSGSITALDTSKHVTSVQTTFTIPETAESSTGTETAFFVSGLLTHLRATTAFTLPTLSSYARVVDGAWTGGTWVAWGTQNRETPLRRVQQGRWEVRCLDGTANMYLAIAAIMAAGLQGLRGAPDKFHSATPTVSQTMESIPLAGADVDDDDVFHEAPDSTSGASSLTPPPLQVRPQPLDCERNPSKLTSEERAAYNIYERMPRRLEEALEALRLDHSLRTLMGETLCADYLAMKDVEISMLKAMENDQRRAWEIERY